MWANILGLLSTLEGFVLIISIILHRNNDVEQILLHGYWEKPSEEIGLQLTKHRSGTPAYALSS